MYVSSECSYMIKNGGEFTLRVDTIRWVILGVLIFV